MNDLLLYVFGAVGALLYAFPMYIAALSLDPPAKFALHMLLFSVFIGALLAPSFTLLLGSWKPFLVTPTPYPLAVGIGLAVNPLAPIVLRKLTRWAEAYNVEGNK